MIRVDEDDPVGEVQLSFPYRNVQIKKGVDPNDLYDLKTELGRGKFGTVYRCTEKQSGLKLAAKFISIIKKEDRRNVEREVEIMKSLQHPRLLQIYDAIENGKTMCVVLELIEGGELFERVIDDDFILTEKSCTAFMRQICEGVDFIHKQKILHLDMKPENILCLTKTGNRIKIIDFGLARIYDPNKKLQVLFGTPEFVAPEVVNFDQIGYGTDMWSVGVICYVLLSGLSPFMGHTDVETMANVTIGKYDFDDDAFKEISDNAKDFIAKLLVKDITSRMSAEDCLKHAWLLKRPTPDASQMDVAKDNLRLFVDRWTDHPNSPYVFESACQIIAPCSTNGLDMSQSIQSLEGMSPSPCGSIVSSVGSDDAFPLSNGVEEHMFIPNSDYIRRASDSTCFVKTTDVVERLNLADEIRKLTDRLFQLSSTPMELKPTTRSSPVTIGSSQSTQQVPWRRSKHRLTNNSRDVPISPKKGIDSFYMKFQNDVASINTYKTRSLTTSTATMKPSSIENAANGTKDMLLRLLEQWDGPSSASHAKARHNSVSSEWNENENLEQRTISSLNLFFQSRTTNKRNHPFMNTNGFK